MHLVAVGFSSFSMWCSEKICTVHLTLLTMWFLSILICELSVLNIRHLGTRIFVSTADKMLSFSKGGNQLQMCTTEVNDIQV